MRRGRLNQARVIVLDVADPHADGPARHLFRWVGREHHLELGRVDIRTVPWKSAIHVRRDKAALFQWVQGPPGDSLPPEATGAGMEVTKCLKPPDSGHELVTARVCRPS